MLYKTGPEHEHSEYVVYICEGDIHGLELAARVRCCNVVKKKVLFCYLEGVCGFNGHDRVQIKELTVERFLI